MAATLYEFSDSYDENLADYGSLVSFSRGLVKFYVGLLCNHNFERS